jgi:hypothetical protein
MEGLNILTISSNGVIIQIIFQMGLSLRPRTNSKSLYSVLLPETKKCVTLTPSNCKLCIKEVDDKEKEGMRETELRRR